MAKNFDFTIMDALLLRLEKNPNPESVSIVNDLILLSKKASDLGFTMPEIASLCTMGFFVSQEPELQSLLNFMLSKVQPDEVFN
tara:strand:- start:490 stop:741 length:252 start_codon:yes stop_codon:yes gene_type:complete